MQYENRQPPEGINTTRESHVAIFLKLAVVALIVVLLLVVGAWLLGAQVARFIPFEKERQWSASVADKMVEADLINPNTPAGLQLYLDDLVARMQSHMDVPDGFELDIHYGSDDLFNAFTFIGGHLVFNRGLLKRMPNEDALATVVAHEIAHAAHRDPLTALTGGVGSTLVLQMILGGSGSNIGYLVNAGQLTSLSFSRDMETDADRAALAAIYREYGHVAGAAGLFNTFLQVEGEQGGYAGGWLAEFSQTHPLTRNRVDAVYKLADDNGWPIRSEKMTPLPEQFHQWLDSE